MGIRRGGPRALILGATVGVHAACGGTGTPSSPSTTAAIVADTTPFVIALPIAPGDTANLAYGIWPFGVHGGGHAADGHPGFDIEYRIGAPVLAVASGVVDSIIPDAHDPTRLVVQLRHSRSVGDYLTSYSNLVSVPGGVTQGASIGTGQVLGIAGAFPGGGSAMIHFQLGDPTVRNAPTIITSPEPFVTGTARAQLDEIWRAAAYRAEWCEPFLTNSRSNNFPMSRMWTLRTGATAARIDIDCVSDLEDPRYTMRTADGSTIEQGTLKIGWDTRPPTADFRATNGSTRLAMYDIVSDTMRLALGDSGGTRPTSLTGASTYTTR